jgi:predicted metalloprotease with PDZ domain
VIKSIDSRVMDENAYFDEVIGSFKVGEKATVTFVRNGELLEKEIVWTADPAYMTLLYEKSGKKLENMTKMAREAWLGGK